MAREGAAEEDLLELGFCYTAELGLLDRLREIYDVLRPSSDRHPQVNAGLSRAAIPPGAQEPTKSPGCGNKTVRLGDPSEKSI